MRVHRILMAIALVALSIDSRTAQALDFINWTSPTAGTVNSVNLTVSYSGPMNMYVSPSNLSGSDYNPAGTTNQNSVFYNFKPGFTFTFSSPVTDLGLYLIGWRNSVYGGPTDNIYTFDKAPTILSGLSGASVSGNNFVTNATVPFANGILRFPGPLTSLTMTTPNGANGGYVGYSLAVNIMQVPEPSTYAMAGLGVLAIGIVSQSRKNRKV